MLKRFDHINMYIWSTITTSKYAWNRCQCAYEHMHTPTPSNISTEHTQYVICAAFNFNWLIKSQFLKCDPFFHLFASHTKLQSLHYLRHCRSIYMQHGFCQQCGCQNVNSPHLILTTKLKITNLFIESNGKQFIISRS